MNVNDIIDTYKDDIEGAIDALLTEGLSKIRSFRYSDSELFFEKAYLLSFDLIKTEKTDENEMKFADVFSKYTFSLFLENTKNPLKFMEVVVKFKKQNEETNKELCNKIMEVVLDDCDVFYGKYCSDLNSCFYMTWNLFPFISQKLEAENSGLSLQTLIKYLKIIKRCASSLKNSTVTDLSCSIMNNFINHYEKDLKNNQKKLRTVDETKFKNFIFLLQKFLKGTNLKQLEKFEYDVLFDFLMSDFLGKQFYALRRFNSFSTFSKELIEQFHQKDIVKKILFKPNLHHELIQQFSIFLSKLFEYGFYEDSIIEQLWAKTFEKSDELEDYFNAWPRLQASIPAKNQKYFWNLVLKKTPSFASASIRTFLIKISENCNEKDKVEMVNLLWKNAIESTNSEEFVDVINEYIPNDNKFENELKKRCFSLLKKTDESDSESDKDNNENKIIFALKLLIKIRINATDDEENKDQEDFDFLLKNCKLTSNNASTFLNLLSTISCNFVNPLTEEEIELIKNQIVGITSVNSIIVFNFIQGLLNTKKGRLFTPQLLFSLLEWMTKLSAVDSVIFKLIRCLYEMIYSSNKKRKNKNNTEDYLNKAIDSLWDLLYRTDIPDVADFLVKIYIKNCLNASKKKLSSKSTPKKKKKNSKNKKSNESDSNEENNDNNNIDTTFINEFIDKCFQKLDCFGSLTALNFLISEIEDSMNMDDYKIQRNAFDGYKQTLTIHLTKDFISNIKINEGTSYYTFRKIVRNLIKANDSQITLMSGQQKLDRNHVFRNNEKIKVFFSTYENNNNNNNYSNSSEYSEDESDSSFSIDINSIDIEWKKENLPSQILNNYRDKIKSLLDNNDTLICEAALNLLNHLSIDENEVNLLKTKSDLFDINHPFLLVYRLNLLANLVYIKDIDVLTNIFNSDLYSQLVNIVFKMDRNSFTKDEYYDLLLETVVDINKIGAETNELKKSKRNCMKELMHDPNSSLTSIMNWIIEEEKLSPVNITRVIDFLIILADFIQIDKKILLDHQRFPEFFDLTLFNEDQEIRSTFYKVLTYIKTSRIQEFSLSRLSFSRKENCDEYFLLIKRIAKFSSSYENSKFLFDTLVDALNDNLFIYKKIKVKTNDQSLIDASRDLCADLAYHSFIKGIIDNLEFIFPIIYINKNNKNEEEEEEEEKNNIDESELIKKPELLIHILVDKIIFNTNRYVYSPPSLLNLVEMILNRFPSLFQPLVQSLTKFNATIGNIENSYLNLYPSEKKTEKGLNNLGCTCYLNASIQQLFHIKEIRNAIFSYDPTINNENNGSNEDESNDEISKNWLCQLQLLMANLKYAPLNSIDASGFVNNWKMYGNEPINPSEQQDAVEFLQILLDRLDESLPGKPISKCVRGQIIHTIKQIDGDFQSQSYEDFITFTLEVINKKNFSESFDQFLEPDIFDGDNKYNVEEIGQIDATRYHAIKKAPLILIFQLKRFDFDLSTLKRKKINTEYQVDMTVDISKLLWNNNNTENSPCIYELFGIIEHSGSAEGGHYYSYIKSSDIKTEKENDSSWEVFNDSRVSNIDEKEVIKSATGGVYTRHFYDPVSQTVKTFQSTKIDSAYILFYRKKTSTNKHNIDNEIEEEEEENDSEIEEDDSDYPIQFMPEVMLRRFFENMKNLILRHVLFSNEYINFMNYISKVDNFSTFSFIYQYTMKSIVSPAYSIKGSSIIQTAMKKAGTDVNFARYILKKKDNLLINALINYKEQKGAKMACSLAEAAISVINEENKENNHSYNEDAKFIDLIIENKDELIQHTDKFDFVFKPFFYYLQLEDVSFDLAKKYLDFFMDLLESIYSKDKEETLRNQRNKQGKYKSACISQKTEGSESNITINEAQIKINNSFVKESSQFDLYSRVDFKNINMMHVFKSILILIEKNDFEKEDKDYYHSIKDKVIKREFMDIWSQSRYHAFNFNSLIVHFLKDDRKLTDKYFSFLYEANEIPVDNDLIEEYESSTDSKSDKKNEKEIKTKGKVKFSISKKSNKNKNHSHDSGPHVNSRELSKKSNKRMTIQKLSAIFVNLLTFRDSLTSYRIQWFFEFTEKLKWSNIDRGNFLKESSTNLKNHYNDLNPLSSGNEKDQIIIDSSPLFDSDSPYLIKKFLLSEDQYIRSSCASFIYSIFPSFPKIKISNGLVLIEQAPKINNNNNDNSNNNSEIYYDYTNINKVKFVKESEIKANANVQESESDSGESDASEHSVHENDKDESESIPNINAQKNFELQTMIKLFNVLMGMIKEVSNISKEIAASAEDVHGIKSIPTDYFFELLSWCSFYLIEESAKEKNEDDYKLTSEEIEFLNNFDLSRYSNLFSDLITKFSSFKNNIRSSVIDLLRYIYVIFTKNKATFSDETKSNRNEETKKKKHKKHNNNINVVIDQSNSIIYLNALSHFPSGFELTNFINNATMYFLPLITPFADKIEGPILKSKFIEVSLKMIINNESFSMNTNQIHANATEESYYDNNNAHNSQESFQSNQKNIGIVILDFVKKLKVSEKLCSLLWKKRKGTSWGRSSILIDISCIIIKTGGFQAVNYFDDFNCVNSIINEFVRQYEVQQMNFSTWESMLKLIHLYNRCYLDMQNCSNELDENEEEESTSSSKKMPKNNVKSDVKSSKNNGNGKNSKIPHSFNKKFMKKFVELWKDNYKFLSTINCCMKKGIEKFSTIALKVLIDVLINASQLSPEIFRYGVRIISYNPDEFYSSLVYDQIREKYAKMEIQIIRRNKSNEKPKKSKSSTDSNQLSVQANPSNLAEREAQRMIQTKLFNSDLLELFLNEIENEETKAKILIDFLTNFTNFTQINDHFISESIEVLRKNGHANEKKKRKEKVGMSKKEKKKSDDSNSEKETEIDFIANNVSSLLEKAILKISKATDEKSAIEILNKITLGEKLLELLREPLNADAKFVPTKKKGIERVLNDLNLLKEKNPNKKVFKKLSKMLERILPERNENELNA